VNSQNQEKPLFDDVLNEYYKYILKFVAKQVNNIEDAKDLTQDIFMKAYNNYSRYDANKAAVKTWLFAIANNHVINFWKSSYLNRKSTIDLDTIQLKSSEDILETVIQEEDVKLILSLMSKLLNKRNIKIMNLYFFSELAPKDISETLQMNQKTVSNVISLSIKKIKEKLEDNNERI
jgi:RNA polymerase sigma-70 factor (ECF subfamily)